MWRARDAGVICGVAHSQTMTEVGRGDTFTRLETTPLDWSFVLWQMVLMTGMLLVQNAVTGVVLSAAMLLLWKRWGGWREAVVALFVVACVLASSRTGGLQYWKTLRLVFAGLLFLEAVVTFRNLSGELRRGSLAFIVLIVLCTGIPALLSAHVKEGLVEMVLLSSMWWAMLVLGRTDEDESTATRFRTMVHLGLIVALVSVLVRYANFELGHLNGRFRGIFGNPNEFSHWWLGLAVLGLVSCQKVKHPRTLILLAATLLLYFWSGTRGALVAFFLSLGGWFVLGIPQSFFSQMVKVLLVSSGVMLLTAISTDVLLEVLPERVVRVESLEQGGGRLLAWEHAYDQVMENPWIGEGGGAEERYFRENYAFFAIRNHQGLSHNSWLAFAMNFGIPATLVLFGMLLTRLGLVRRRLFIVGALPWMFSFTVEGWLTAPMSASSPMLFFAGGLLASVMAANKELQQAED